MASSRLASSQKLTLISQYQVCVILKCDPATVPLQGVPRVFPSYAGLVTVSQLRIPLGPQGLVQFCELMLGI